MRYGTIQGLTRGIFLVFPCLIVDVQRKKQSFMKGL